MFIDISKENVTVNFLEDRNNIFLRSVGYDVLGCTESTTELAPINN